MSRGMPSRSLAKILEAVRRRRLRMQFPGGRSSTKGWRRLWRLLTVALVLRNLRIEFGDDRKRSCQKQNGRLPFSSVWRRLRRRGRFRGRWDVRAASSAASKEAPTGVDDVRGVGGVDGVMTSPVPEIECKGKGQGASG